MTSRIVRVLTLGAVLVAAFAGLVASPNTATASPPSGGRQTEKIVQPGKIHVYDEVLVGGEKTRVRVLALQAPLTVKVYNPAGILLGSRTIPTGNPNTFYITVGSTGAFRFEVVNDNGFPVQYAIILD